MVGCRSGTSLSQSRREGHRGVERGCIRGNRILCDCYEASYFEYSMVDQNQTFHDVWIARAIPSLARDLDSTETQRGR